MTNIQLSKGSVMFSGVFFSYAKQFCRMFVEYIFVCITSVEIEYHKPRGLFLSLCYLLWSHKRWQVTSSCVSFPCLTCHIRKHWE